MNVSRPSILEYGKPLRALDLAAPDALWERVELLQRDDRVLVELALRGGVSHRRIAQMVNRTAGCVSRRLARIARRLHDPLVLALLHPACPLEPSSRQIAVERLLSDLSVEELARKHERTRTEVRRIVNLVKLWHRGVAARRS
jgi:hypothetical protein